MALTVFLKNEVIARGKAAEVVPIMRKLEPLARSSDLIAFDDETGHQVDLNLRAAPDETPKKRGRPSLGVEAKEVTLLPRHWKWLSQQRGGASAGLRRMVEDAMRAGRTPRECHNAAYWFLTVIAGDMPNFEDAVREIYAGNNAGYDDLTTDWPQAVRDHGRDLAFPQ